MKLGHVAIHSEVIEQSDQIRKVGGESISKKLGQTLLEIDDQREITVNPSMAVTNVVSDQYTSYNFNRDNFDVYILPIVSQNQLEKFVSEFNSRSLDIKISDSDISSVDESYMCDSLREYLDQKDTLYNEDNKETMNPSDSLKSMDESLEQNNKRDNGLGF